MRTVLIVSMALVIASCSDSLRPSPRTLDGGWDRLDEVPGSSEHWDISVADTTITGSGTWSGEACCGGTLSISGYILRDSVHIALTRVTTQGAVMFPSALNYFDGVLQDSDLLVGKNGRYRKSR